MSTKKRSVLITGCSDGGMGAALAVAFHNAGLHVYATARNPSKMEQLASLGVETLTLDIQSESSIAECVSKIPNLDILVNNAGAQSLMPVTDINIAEAKRVYDLNIWSHIAMIQAFLPLLLQSSDGMIVNHTSIGAVLTLPFAAVYNSSKAAWSHISDTLRLELQPFGIKVVNLKTGVVKTNLIRNFQDSKNYALPTSSLYEPAKDSMEKILRQEQFEDQGMPSEQWASLTIRDLLLKNPPPVIWRGESAWVARIGTMLPFGMLDGIARKATGLDTVAKELRK